MEDEEYNIYLLSRIESELSVAATKAGNGQRSSCISYSTILFAQLIGAEPHTGFGGEGVITWA